MKKIVALIALTVAVIFGAPAGAYDDHASDVCTLSYPPVCSYQPASPVAYLKYADGALPPTHVGDYRYIITSGGWSSQDLASVPSDVTVLHYMSAIDCLEGESWHYGVTAEQARSNGWILMDGSTELYDPNYGTYQCDPGSSGYQQAWITNVEALLADFDADGVFIDNTLRGGDLDPDNDPDLYSTQAAWEAAMEEFASVVGPALEEDGFNVAFNASGYIDGDSGSDDGSNEIEWHTALQGYGEAFMTEACQNNPWRSPPVVRKTGNNWYEHWEGWQSAQEDSADNNRGLLCMDTTTQAGQSVSDKRYVLQSFLLDWNGHDGAFVAPYVSGDPWIGAMGNAISLGHPVESKHLDSGVWSRDFEHGYVWVNPGSGTGGIVLD